MCLFCETGRRPIELRYSRPVRPPTIAERLQGPADIILRGGEILTMDDGHPAVEALAIRNGLVKAAGPVDTVLEMKGRHTRIIDLDQRAVIPGMVMPDVFANPIELLDWQTVSLIEAAAEPRDYLANAIMRPMFSQPLFVRLSGESDYEDAGPILSALQELCARAPLAVVLGETSKGFLNEAMMRLAGRELGNAAHPVSTGFVRVDDMTDPLRPLAYRADHTSGSLSRVLSKIIKGAATEGHTTVVYPQMGGLAGKFEITAASAVAEAKRTTKINAAAHRRLREEWDGVLSEEIDPDLLCVRSALIDLDESDEYVKTEAATLADAGWRVVFGGARSKADLDRLIELRADLRATGQEKASGHRVGIRFVPSERQRRALDALGISCLVEAADHEILENPEEGADVLANLRHRTRDAARRCGLERIAGTIAVGRPADFAMLERSPIASGSANVVGTWVDGIPVGQ